MAVPLGYGVLFSATWLLAAELLDGVDRDALGRAYAMIGSASIAGGMLGGVLARTLAMVLEPAAFLTVGAGALAASAGVVVAAHRRHAPHVIAGNEESSGPPRIGDARVVLGERYGVLLLAIGMATAFVGVLIEFQFYLAAAIATEEPRAQVRFFADFYLLLNGTALLVQLYAIPRLQRRLGIHGSLLVMPAVLLGGASALALYATMTTRAALRVTEGGLKASIHRTNWEQTFAAFRGGHRAVAKLLVDAVGGHLAEGLAAALLFVWLRAVVGDGDLAAHSPAWITVLLIAGTGFLLAAIRRLRPFLGRPEGFTDTRVLRAIAPPPDGCAATALLGRTVQESECRRRYGPGRDSVATGY